jgi:hypothetical protein
MTIDFLREQRRPASPSRDRRAGFIVHAECRSSD